MVVHTSSRVASPTNAAPLPSSTAQKSLSLRSVRPVCLTLRVPPSTSAVSTAVSTAGRKPRVLGVSSRPSRVSDVRCVRHSKRWIEIGSGSRGDGLPQGQPHQHHHPRDGV